MSGRTPAALALGLWWLAAAPAAAWPEGRFADADGASVAALRPSADGGVALQLRGPLLDTPLDVTLRRREDGGLLYEAERAAGWWARLFGSQPVALPFDGERLVFAREEDRALIVTTLEVAADGRPTMVRLGLAPAGNDLRLTLRRYDAGEIAVAEPLILERVAP